MSIQALVSPLDSNFSAVYSHLLYVKELQALTGGQWLDEAGSPEGDLLFDFKVDKELAELPSVVWPLRNHWSEV